MHQSSGWGHRSEDVGIPVFRNENRKAEGGVIAVGGVSPGIISEGIGDQEREALGILEPLALTYSICLFVHLAVIPEGPPWARKTLRGTTSAENKG